MKIIYETSTKDYMIYRSGNELMCSIRRKENPHYIIKQFNVYNNQDDLDGLPVEVKNKVFKEMI